MNKGNEPAYPCNINFECGDMQHEGITKREYFAAMAMQGILISRDGYGRNGLCEMPAEDIAQASFKQADAMIEVNTSKE